MLIRLNGMRRNKERWSWLSGTGSKNRRFWVQFPISVKNSKRGAEFLHSTQTQSKIGLNWETECLDTIFLPVLLYVTREIQREAKQKRKKKTKQK